MKIVIETKFRCQTPSNDTYYVVKSFKPNEQFTKEQIVDNPEDDIIYTEFNSVTTSLTKGDVD